MTPRDTQKPKLDNLEKRLLRNSSPLQVTKMDDRDARVFLRKINRSAWWRKNRLREPADLLIDAAFRGCTKDYQGNTPNGTPVAGAGFNCRVCHRLELGNSTVWSNLDICHQVAHYITATEGQPLHGPAFCKAYLETVRKFMGEDAKRDLTLEFKNAGIKYISWSKNARADAKQRAVLKDMIALREELTR